MSPEAFHAAALALPGASFDVKWESNRVYSVGGKMFAMAGHLGEAAPLYAFKASDMAFELLVAQGLARPAPYLARARWVQLTAADVLDERELLAYLAEAHRIVAARLPRRTRAQFGLA